MTGLVNIVLELIQRLRGHTGQAVLGPITVGIEIVPEQAAASGRVAVPEPAAVFTVKLPVPLAAAVRELAAASGRTISAVVAQALEEF